MADQLRCKCGGTLFLEKQKVRGDWVVLFDSSDPQETIDTNLDGLTHRIPGTVACADCGKKYPNPRLASADGVAGTSNNQKGRNGPA